MDENTYRRVISRNVDEFTLNNNGKTAQNEENRVTSDNFSDSYNSERNEETYNRNVGTRQEESAGYGSRSNYVGQRENRPAGNEGRYNYYTRSVSSDYNQDYWTKKTNINLKQIKAVGINCAKSLTNKLINLSTSSSSSYNNSHMYNSSRYNNKYNYSSNQMNASANYGPSNVGHSSSSSTSYGMNTYNASSKSNHVYSLNSIANRISTTDDPIRTHRELVAVIEHTLTHRNYLIEINIEKDRFGSPSIDSINKFTLINKQLLEKIVNYSLGKRDCCVFLVKFATWKMRSTKKPEEVILSIELISQCVRVMGGFFLSLFTKSLMKTFRRLLFLTHFKHSITSNVKKKLVKLLGKGTQFVHPGVSTDIRIHIFKLKILYLIQLYYETFLFEQDEYVVFYEGYKDMRLRGVKFPSIKEEDKKTINKSYVFTSSYTSNYPGGGGGAYEVGVGAGGPMRSREERSYYSELNIDLNELDQLLFNINNHNIDTEYIARVRSKLLHSIEILSNKKNLDRNGVQLLDKILKLNDSLLLLLNKNNSSNTSNNNSNNSSSNSLTSSCYSIAGNYHTSSANYNSYNTYKDNNTYGDDNIYKDNENDEQKYTHKQELREDNLLLEHTESEPRAKAERGGDFDFFNKEFEKEEEDEGVGSENSNIKENLDDIFNFISLTSFNVKGSELTPGNESKSEMNALIGENELSEDEQLDFEDEDELINNFINSNNFGFTPTSGNLGDDDRQDGSGSKDNHPQPKSSTDNDQTYPSNNNTSNNNNNTSNKDKDKEDEKNEKVEKNLSELVSELDNLELDFGHMSATNF